MSHQPPRRYVPLDVNFSDDPAVRRAGPHAELLFVRGLQLVKRLEVDGTIDRAQLPILAAGIPGRPASHAGALVDEGLWTATAAGWEITGWLRWNPAAADLAAGRAARSAGAALTNHRRHHLDRGITDPNCTHCTDPDSDRSSDQSSERLGSLRGSRSGSRRGKPPSSSNARDIDTPALTLVDDGDDDPILHAATRLLAAREADRRTDISSRTAWITTRARNLTSDLTALAGELRRTDPTLTTARDLADALEGAQRIRTRPTFAQGAPG